ncbi:response regulator [Undibacterium sp. RTI2.1]|uniref:response regulator n=1 Tax=unclassified Undibacterium TaxID=2630295 RepID=UPI002B229F11|nr:MULTISPECIES: response regulator [unclassified Undibacterium]MEB0033044.1 response regulator [Undibacterium sp. RTI2.1]MEB0118892.1 response regulator [Undibacterium sp. RTI2.2]
MTGINILLVEDDEVDVMSVKRAFRELKIANPMTEAKDGIEALEILRGVNGCVPIPHPLIILLDLNMPRMGGLEFLDELRKDPDLHRCVVFIMTTSADERDRVRAYDKNVAGYLLKHDPGRSFMDAIAMLQHYWRVVELPYMK